MQIRHKWSAAAADTGRADISRPGILRPKKLGMPPLITAPPCRGSVQPRTDTGFRPLAAAAQPGRSPLKMNRDKNVGRAPSRCIPIYGRLLLVGDDVL